jgi:hypothetical protein
MTMKKEYVRGVKESTPIVYFPLVDIILISI